jgi:hypothetical protein
MDIDFNSIDMTTTFNANNFIKSFKEGYEAIANHQGDQAAKVQVGDAIKATGFNPDVVLAYICDRMGNPSIKLSNEEWKDIIKRAIKNGDLVGKCLEVCAAVENGSKKVSYEDLFSAVVSLCGGNPNLLLQELYLNQVGWNKVADTLVKTEVETEVAKIEDTKTVEKAVVKKEKKSSIKTPKVDPRSKSVILIKDGVKKEWASYSVCEKEIGVGHGIISQLVSGKVKKANGWSLWKEESKTPVKSHKHPRNKAVRQYGVDKDGHKVDRIWSSITEASKATGISHSGISKTVTGTYQSAGGYKWEKTNESAA